MKATTLLITIIATMLSCEQPLGPGDIPRSDPGVTHGNVEYADREKP